MDDPVTISRLNYTSLVFMFGFLSASTLILAIGLIELWASKL